MNLKIIFDDKYHYLDASVVIYFQL